MADRDTEKTQLARPAQATSSARTPAAKSTSAGTSVKPTATASSTTATSATGATSTPVSPPAEASPRNGVAVNVTSVTTAFHNGAKSRSVRGIQLALTERGFAPGNVEGLVDYGTRAAYAKFQRDVGERATGIPTANSLDILGFDVVG